MDMKMKQGVNMFIVYEDGLESKYPAGIILANKLDGFVLGLIETLTKHFDYEVNPAQFIQGTPDVFDGSHHYQMDVEIDGMFYPIDILACTDNMIVDYRGKGFNS